MKIRNFRLEGRNLEILAATVRTYIATGGPVGSRTISRKRRDGLSAASVRNIMADLEEAGYLEQPHTSAGRVPTEKAYRFYVDHVACAHKYQNRSDEQLIRREIDPEASESSESILGRASHVLSSIAHNVGIVASATNSETVLHDIQFVSLSDSRILVVLVPRGAPVRNRVIRVEEKISQDGLDRIANYLNQNFAGWRLQDARNEILRRLEQERALYDELLRRLATLWRQGILDSDTNAGVYLDGTSHLMGRPELGDPSVLRDLLRALEEKERILRLLSYYLQAPQEPGARVVIGLEMEPVMKDFALVGALCTTADGLAGRVAVLGPQRMPYERIIAAVSHVAELVGRAMNQR